MPPSQNVSFSTRYRNYVLGVLLVINIFNFIDRSILAILLQPIKLELQLTDTQLGVLSGAAFAIFYSTLGVPIARLADRHSRVNIMSLSLTAWSLMTAVCGLAQNFWQLLLFRVGVGVGEAGCTPPGHALISDYFTQEQRGTAISIFSLGISIGGMIGLLAGGWIVQNFDWRVAFFVVGLPGVAMAIIVRLTVIEPPRGNSESHQHDTTPPEMMEVARYLWRMRSFRHIALGSALQALVFYAVNGWLPALLVRSFQMSSVDIGIWLALIFGLVAGLGTFAGGFVGDRLGKRDRRWYAWVPCIAIAITIPFSLFAYMAQSANMLLLLIVVPAFFGYFFIGPAFATIQSLAQVRMRALASGVLFLIVNLIAIGLGTLSVGIASDLLQPVFGENSLRYALMGVTLISFWAMTHFYFAARTLREDYDSNPDRQPKGTVHAA